LRIEGKQNGGKKVHGVMVCRSCYSADRHPLHWHRDINAARNMVTIYQHLASEHLRPTCFTLSDCWEETRVSTLAHLRVGFFNSWLSHGSAVVMLSGVVAALLRVVLFQKACYYRAKDKPESVDKIKCAERQLMIIGSLLVAD